MALPAARMRSFVTQVGVRQREHAREALIATARAEQVRVIRQQTQRAGGIAPTLTRIVDGKRNAPLEAVKENGLIILQWKYLREIAVVTMRRLRERAPEVSGDYKRGIKLCVGNGEAAATAGGIPPTAQQLTVVSTVPYARRIEIGKDRQGGPFVVQVPQHVVEETAKLVALDYRGVATVRFVYEDLDGPAAAASRGSARARRAVRYPAIRVVDDR